MSTTVKKKGITVNISNLIGTVIVVRDNADKEQLVKEIKDAVSQIVNVTDNFSPQ